MASSEAQPTGFYSADDWRQVYPALAQLFGPILYIEDFDTDTVQRHVADLALLPESMNRRLIQTGLKEIHLANRPVPELDDLSRLRGLPVSAASQRTWDDVPGAYTEGRLAIGTGRLGADGGRKVMRSNRIPILLPNGNLLVRAGLEQESIVGDGMKEVVPGTEEYEVWMNWMLAQNLSPRLQRPEDILTPVS